MNHQDTDSSQAPILDVTIVVQARMGAFRLPGKPLKEVLGKPLLFYLLERLKRCQQANKIVVATTENPKDLAIYHFAKDFGVEAMMGDEENVLSRFWKAAKQFNSDVIVRITADCPLMDPSIVDQMIANFLFNYSTLDYLSNTVSRTYPRGLDVEVFSKKALEKAFQNAKESFEKEHVTPYIYQHRELFKIGNVAYKEDASCYRLTVDTEEDFRVIRHVFEELYPKNPSFCLEDILKVMKDHPEWAAINRDVKQKTL